MHLLFKTLLTLPLSTSLSMPAEPRRIATRRLWRRRMRKRHNRSRFPSKFRTPGRACKRHPRRKRQGERRGRVREAMGRAAPSLPPRRLRAFPHVAQQHRPVKMAEFNKSNQRRKDGAQRRASASADDAMMDGLPRVALECSGFDDLAKLRVRGNASRRKQGAAGKPLSVLSAEDESNELLVTTRDRLLRRRLRRA